MSHSCFTLSPSLSPSLFPSPSVSSSLSAHPSSSLCLSPPSSSLSVSSLHPSSHSLSTFLNPNTDSPLSTSNSPVFLPFYPNPQSQPSNSNPNSIFTIRNLTTLNLKSIPKSTQTVCLSRSPVKAKSKLNPNSESKSKSNLTVLCRAAVEVGVPHNTHSSSKLSPIGEAVEAIREGKLVLVVDDEDRENEGDLIMAGERATPEKIAFMLKYCSGLICCPTSPSLLERLSLPLMVPPTSNSDAYRTAFTVSVDYLEGCESGLSATDRARTIRAIGLPKSQPQDFRRPGHVFPLSARPLGVLQRAGHTEAAVDLAVLAGLAPVGVLCEVVKRDGSMARIADLFELAEKEGLCLISIADLIRYRLERESVLIPADVTSSADVAPNGDLANSADVATADMATFRVHRFESILDGTEHLALTLGDVSDSKHDVHVHINRQKLTENSMKNKSRNFLNFSKNSSSVSSDGLREAMDEVVERGRGVIVCLQGREGEEGEEDEEAVLEAGKQSLNMRAVAIAGQIILSLGVKNSVVQKGDSFGYFLEEYLNNCRHRFLK